MPSGRVADVSRGGAEALARVAAWLSRVRSGADALARVHPAYVLGPLLAAQLAALGAFAAAVRHDGWLYYSGGDATQYWSAEWALAHGWIPDAVLGYGVPVFYAWVPLLLGDTLAQGAPAIVVVQGALVGVGLLLAYAIGARIAGRLFGYLSALAWLVVPFWSIRFFRPSFREDFTTYFLGPHGFGLTNMGDFPSLVVLMAATLATFRAIDRRSANDALVAGLLAGLAIGIKPANALFLPAPLLAIAATRGWRSLPLFGAGLVPAVVTLALWKQQGLGNLPLFGSPAPGKELPGPEVPGIERTRTYLDFTWVHYQENLAAIREVFWSRLLLEYLPIAGAFAVIRKAPAKGLALAWIVLAYFVLKGGSSQTNVFGTSFFRLTSPAFFAYLLLAVGVVLLVPPLGRRIPRPAPPRKPLRPTASVVAAVVLFGLAPLAVVAAAAPAPAGTLARDLSSSNEAPVSDAFAATATRTDEGVRLSWDAIDTGPSRTFYVVYRGPAGASCPPVAQGARICAFELEVAGRTGGTTFVDEEAPAGRLDYRIAAAANYGGSPEFGDDLMLMSPTLTVPGR